LNDIDSNDFFHMTALKDLRLNSNKCINKDFKTINPENLKEIKAKCSGKFADTTNQVFEPKGKGKASKREISLVVCALILLMILAQAYE
jgi:hypothetical protein